MKRRNLSSDLVAGSVTSRIGHSSVNHSTRIKFNCHLGHSVTHSPPIKQTCYPAHSGTDSVSRRTEETQFRSQVFPCWIFGGQIGTGTGVAPSAIFIHSSTTLYINLAKDNPLSATKQQYWPLHRSVKHSATDEHSASQSVGVLATQSHRAITAQTRNVIQHVISA